MKTLTTILSKSKLKSVEKVSPGEINDQLVSGKITGLAVITCAEATSVDIWFPSGIELPLYYWQNLGGCARDCGGFESIIPDKMISNIIVFGHHPCEIVEIGVRKNFECSNFSETLQKHFHSRTNDTHEAVKERFGNRFDSEVLTKATEDFVLRQVAELLKIPVISEGAERNKIKIHAWIFNELCSQFTCFDPALHKFLPVEKPALNHTNKLFSF